MLVRSYKDAFRLLSSSSPATILKTSMSYCFLGRKSTSWNPNETHPFWYNGVWRFQVSWQVFGHPPNQNNWLIHVWKSNTTKTQPYTLRRERLPMLKMKVDKQKYDKWSTNSRTINNWNIRKSWTCLWGSCSFNWRMHLKHEEAGFHPRINFCCTSWNLNTKTPKTVQSSQDVRKETSVAGVLFWIQISIPHPETAPRSSQTSPTKQGPSHISRVCFTPPNSPWSSTKGHRCFKMSMMLVFWFYRSTLCQRKIYCHRFAGFFNQTLRLQKISSTMSHANQCDACLRLERH